MDIVHSSKYIAPNYILEFCQTNRLRNLYGLGNITEARIIEGGFAVLVHVRDEITMQAFKTHQLFTQFNG